MLDRFKSAAAAIASASTPADRLWLVSASGVIAGGTSATVRDAIGALQPTGAVADLPGAVRRAAGLARAAGQDARAVVVLTDGQQTSWPAAVATDAIRTVVWAPALTVPENHAVTLAEARPIRWTPHGEIAARFQARDSVTYRVTIGGRTLARGTAGPNEEATVHAAPAERGWVGGSVDIAPDELAADDSRYFAVWIGAAPATFATPGAGEFVEAALATLRASGRIVAGNSIAIGPADEIGALPAMITAPTDPVRLGAANRALQRLGVPWRFGARRQQSVDASGPGLANVPVTDRYELVPQAGADADTLAAAGQSPWIVAGARYVLIGSPLIASASGFPVRATFIPWISAAITDRLSGDPGTVVAAAPGATIRRPAGADQLERPDGSHLVLTDSVSLPMNPGVYFFMSGGRRTGAVVVNAPVAESKLDRLSPADAQRTFAGATIVDAVDPAALQTAAFRASATRSLLPIVLIAVLVTLFAETLIVTARRREAV